MERFRKKPVVIEAVQWKGPTVGEVSVDEIQKWGCPVEPNGVWGREGHEDEWALLIPTLEGKMKCSVNDWIIQGVKGEFYPCKPDIFAATYEPA